MNADGRKNILMIVRNLYILRFLRESAMQIIVSIPASLARLMTSVRSASNCFIGEVAVGVEHGARV